MTDDGHNGAINDGSAPPVSAYTEAEDLVLVTDAYLDGAEAATRAAVAPDPFRDAYAKKIEALEREQEKKEGGGGVPALTVLASSLAEAESAKLHPRCIVSGYLYADVAELVAPGGAGKTTLMLWEATHIALGIPLYGREVRSPGAVVIVSAEDSREMLLGRMLRIMGAMELPEADQERVFSGGVLIWDVSGLDLRLVSTDGSFRVSELADAMIEEWRGAELAAVIFDPTISFGADESSVNTNEQALVTAARRIKNELNCLVRYIHHTGQQVARDKTVDQYAGRGGTALPDGARMVSVLMPWEPPEKKEDEEGEDDHGDRVGKRGMSAFSPPAKLLPLQYDDKIMVLSSPKMSYAATPETIWIRRRGAYDFSWASGETEDESMQRRNGEDGAIKSGVMDFIEENLLADSPEPMTPNALATKHATGFGIGKKRMSRLVFELINENLLEMRGLPKGYIQGARKNFLMSSRLSEGDVKWSNPADSIIPPLEDSGG